MGVSSSQPLSNSQDHRISPPTAKSAAPPSLAKAGPRCSPTMDDEAASQQLMSEARATTHSADYKGPAIPLNLDGASQATEKKSPDSGNQTTRRLGRMQAGQRDTVRGSPLPAYSLQDLQDFIGTSPSKSRAIRSAMRSTQIEVPDSQAETYANGAAALTQSTASQTASPDTSNKRSKKGKKKNKNVQAEAVVNSSNAIPATPYEEPGVEATPPSSAASKSQASHKQRRKDKSRASVNSVGLDTTEVVETPAASGTAPEDLDQDADQLPLTPRDLFDKLKAERSQKSQSASKLRSPADAHEAATEEVDIEAEAAGATATADTPETSGKSASKRKRTREGKEVAEPSSLEQDAPIPSMVETSSQPFTYMDSGAEGTSSRGESSTNGGKRPRYSVGGVVTMRKRRMSRADPNKTYQRAHTEDDRTAADKALETTHELGHPPDKRTRGDFTADEKELIRRAIRDYQERSSLDTADLVEIIQWTPRRDEESNDHQTEAQSKRDSDAFWDEINNVGLLRKTKDLRQHIRATYHMCQRGRWSTEDEEQLRDLVNLHPGQWRLIATQLNRLEIDAYNRWKDYVRHGEKRNIKRWTTEEEENLVRVLSMICQRVEDLRAESGKPPLDDYYPVINWHEVCRELDDTRSRLQCQTKWKTMRARMPPATLDIEIRPRKTPPPEKAPAKKKSQKSKAKKSRQSAVEEIDLSPPGPDDMLWGDKFDLVAEVSEQVTTHQCTSDDQIVWQDIAKKMDFRWSVRTLQIAFKQLCELILDGEDVEDDDDDMPSRLALLLHYMKDNHKDEMEYRYQAPGDIEAGLEDDVEAESRVKSNKKRKRQSGVGSDTGSGKKHSKRTLSAAKTFKSKELVTDSEPEL